LRSGAALSLHFTARCAGANIFYRDSGVHRKTKSKDGDPDETYERRDEIQSVCLFRQASFCIASRSGYARKIQHGGCGARQ